MWVVRQSRRNEGQDPFVNNEACLEKPPSPDDVRDRNDGSSERVGRDGTHLLLPRYRVVLLSDGFTVGETARTDRRSVKA